MDSIAAPNPVRVFDVGMYRCFNNNSLPDFLVPSPSACSPNRTPMPVWDRHRSWCFYHCDYCLHDSEWPVSEKVNLGNCHFFNKEVNSRHRAAPAELGFGFATVLQICRAAGAWETERRSPDPARWKIPATSRRDLSGE